MAFFIIILVYDIRHTIIPDEMTAGVAVIAALMLILEYVRMGDAGSVLMQLVSGGAVALFFWTLWRVSEGRWIGFGDVKLALPLGALLGGAAAFSMVVFSFWIGALISLMILGVQRLLKKIQKGKTKMYFFGAPLTMKSEIPFAPFLLAGFLLTYLFHADAFSIIDRMFFTW
jgi:leader peptidase (prepilin peptidase)/N-methyltransferase